MPDQVGLPRNFSGGVFCCDGNTIILPDCVKASSSPSNPLSSAIPHVWKQIFFWGKLSVAVICIVTMWCLLPAGPAPLKFIWTHPWLVIAAVLLRPVFTLVMAFRTLSLTSMIVPDLQPGTVIRATFIGQMANLILPSGVGGDLVRGTILWRKSQQPWPRIVTVLVIDRMLGTGSLLFCVVVLSFPLLIRISPPTWLGTGAALAVAFLAVA